MFVRWLAWMPVKHLAPMSSVNLVETVAGRFLRRRIKRRDPSPFVRREHPAANTVNDVFMEGPKPTKALLLLQERLVSKTELIRQLPAEKADNHKCKADIPQMSGTSLDP